MSVTTSGLVPSRNGGRRRLLPRGGLHTPLVNYGSTVATYAAPGTVAGSRSCRRTHGRHHRAEVQEPARQRRQVRAGAGGHQGPPVASPGRRGSTRRHGRGRTGEAQRCRGGGCGPGMIYSIGAGGELAHHPLRPPGAVWPRRSGAKPSAAPVALRRPLPGPGYSDSRQRSLPSQDPGVTCAG
jgi:hypothetical protein